MLHFYRRCFILSIVLNLFERGNAEVDWNTTICVEAQMGHLHGVEKALIHGADPNRPCDAHFANRTPLLRASVEGHVDIVRVLLAAGADVERFDRSGRNSLLHASNSGDELTVRALLEVGADTAARDPDGKTALLQACKNGRGGTVIALVEGGADVSAVDNFGGSTLMWCSDGGSAAAVKALLQAHQKKQESKEEAQAWINQQNQKGNTALILAATTSQSVHMMRRTSVSDHFLEIVKALLKAGADPNIAALDGMTALMSASRWSKSPKIVAELIKGGSALSLKDTSGRTALMFAAFANFVEAAKLLVKAGAGIDVMNNDGWTAETIAIKKEHHDVRRVFSDVRMRRVAPELFRTSNSEKAEYEEFHEKDFQEKDVPKEVRQLYEEL
mmetsp:Transcript_4267/g.5690  ORF Transcript_4267/g.5690 Transcript_4267/m.5690 type:complete len:387 (-) Transcript_4267:148-1308(-)|eukprot:CAMPEP_0196584894 /NCGR_PEP_ID=MMETSP1081-20130531/48898_1 /TAXON_ID=36882 /ORGANISM="Pyramimonas amylifera, Strain CCMP720" /LENGTH=386 /DNA_ID=CAMNT_0041906273 /DNA_START=113 /DNA_END=1273 /DNA_ORIENTATION=+